MKFKEALAKAEFSDDRELVDRFISFLDANESKFLGRKSFVLEFDAFGIDNKAITNLATYVEEAVDYLRELGESQEKRNRIRRALCRSVCNYIKNPDLEHLQRAGDLVRTFYDFVRCQEERLNIGSRFTVYDYTKPMLIGMFR
ncbi:hypothetical protein J4216_02495 [Candidatus Woesearchaeota archaeon]|nr:hypothetical protein [Candidatus Woesearchaeota archaeon]